MVLNMNSISFLKNARFFIDFTIIYMHLKLRKGLFKIKFYFKSTSLEKESVKWFKCEYMILIFTLYILIHYISYALNLRKKRFSHNYKYMLETNLKRKGSKAFQRL